MVLFKIVLCLKRADTDDPDDLPVNFLVDLIADNSHANINVLAVGLSDDKNRQGHRVYVNFAHFFLSSMVTGLSHEFLRLMGIFSSTPYFEPVPHIQNVIAR